MFCLIKRGERAQNKQIMLSDTVMQRPVGRRPFVHWFGDAVKECSLISSVVFKIEIKILKSAKSDKNKWKINKPACNNNTSRDSDCFLIVLLMSSLMYWYSNKVCLIINLPMLKPLSSSVPFLLNNVCFLHQTVRAGLAPVSHSCSHCGWL